MKTGYSIGRIAFLTFAVIVATARTSVYVDVDAIHRAAAEHDASLDGFGPVVANAARSLEAVIISNAIELHLPERTAPGRIGFVSALESRAGLKAKSEKSAGDAAPIDRFFAKVLRTDWFTRLRAIGVLFVKRLSLLLAFWGLTAWLWGGLLLDAILVRRARVLEDGRSNRLLLLVSSEALIALVPASLVAMLAPGSWSPWASVAAIPVWAGLLWVWFVNTRRFD